MFPHKKKVQNLMSNPKATVEFTFTDPTDALVRLLLLGPLAADEKNLSFLYREGGTHYADFHDGARMQRICQEMPEGAAPLTSVLFFDEINLDQKGYTTGDGVLLMGGFFTRKARESLFAKYSLGTLPAIPVTTVNSKRAVYVRFVREMRARCHAAIMACYTSFNNAGGAILKLQYGQYMYFPRAVILAIYADFPAGLFVYCVLIGYTLL